MQPPLDIRIADRFFSRLRGLLGRSPLGQAQGLLIRPCNAVHTCAMRYPIDVLFLDRQGRILRLVAALPPWRLRICTAASQTLELAVGEAARLGLVVGLQLPGLAWPNRGIGHV